MALSVCWLLFVLLLAAALCLYRWPKSNSIAILLCVAALGAVRSAMMRDNHEQVTWADAMVDYEAVIISEVTEKPKTMATDAVIIGNGRKVKCYIAKDDKSRQLTIGDRLQLHSRIDRNREWHQGTFDYRRYQEVHGFSGQTYVAADHWEKQAHSWQGLSRWRQWQLHFLCYRHQLLERYRDMGFNDDDYAVVAAMTLGDKSAMSQELRAVYAVSGASHVLALSGLHLGIIYMLFSLLVVGRRWRFITQLTAVAGIWAFALLTGLSLSVVRSAVMISVYALLSLVHRDRASLNALSLAALIILIVSPYSLFDVGFQLSFAAVTAILVIQPYLERIVDREWLMRHPLWRWVWGLTTISIAAQLGVAPLIAYYFGSFPTWFLLTNFIVIPATTVILWISICTLAVPAVGTVLLHMIGWLNSILTIMTTRLPCPSIDQLRPSAVQTMAVYIIIIASLIIVTKYDRRI